MTLTPRPNAEHDPTTPADRLRVVIADDHPLFRMGLRYALGALGFDILAEASTGTEALEACRTHAPDVALLDVKMPGMSGIEVCASITGTMRGVTVVLISTFQEPAILAAARQAGARGYLNKDTEPHELARSLRRIVTEPWHDWLPQAELPHLTPRERDVLALLGRGYSNKEIARDLGLSPDTIKDHLGRLYGKLGVEDRLSLLNKARDLGLV